MLASELQADAQNFDVDLSRFNTDENVVVSAKFMIYSNNLVRNKNNLNFVTDKNKPINQKPIRKFFSTPP